MRPALAALALVLTACGPAPLDPLCELRETRACTCSTGDLGTQACEESRQRFTECACDDVDGGAEIDAAVPSDGDGGLDASAVDAGTDASIVLHDSGPIDAGTDAPSWECSVVPQAGCGVGAACAAASSFARSRR